MKKLITLIAIALTITVAPAIAKNDKVTICHVPPGNPDNAHTITISENALKAHLGDNEEGLHGGDSYGPCDTPTGSSPTPSTPTASPTPTPSSTPTPTTAPTATPSPSPTSSPTPTISPEPTPTCGLPEGCDRPTPQVTLPPTDTLE